MAKRSDASLSFTETARRKQILQAAIELLADGGSSAASLAAIAGRIGASKGVVSYHFDGKDELLAQVVTTVLDDASAFVRSRIEQAQGVRAQLRAYVTANLDYLTSHRQQIRALTAVLAGLPPRPDGAPAYTAANHVAVEALTALLVAGQRSGHFRAVSASVAARSLRASIDVVTDLLRVDPALNVCAYGDELLALFEAGLLR